MTRRKFVKTYSAAALGTAAAMRASSYSKILGANDRINIGFLGCGARSRRHRRMVEMSVKDKNHGVTAVCDIWTENREKGKLTDSPITCFGRMQYPRKYTFSKKSRLKNERNILRQFLDSLRIYQDSSIDIAPVLSYFCSKLNIIGHPQKFFVLL